MREIKVKQLFHLGVVMGIIRDLKIIEMVNERIPSDSKEHITAGEAVAGMILNGLGFTNQTLTMAPHFFESKAINHLFGRNDISSSHFNRFKLGRTLDDISKYGCQNLFYEISFQATQQEKVKTSYICLDTTSFSLDGDYISEEIEVQEPIKVCHGYSKDHRPDLKQLIQDLIVSQDGGIPLMTKTWGGNTSDIKVFQSRVEQLIHEFKQTKHQQCLIADSKLYNEKNSHHLKEIEFITRIPGSIKEEQLIIQQACECAKWIKTDEGSYFQEYEVEHYGIKQRWIVVYSQGSEERANRGIQKAIEKERDLIKREAKNFKRKKFCCQDDAKMALSEFLKKLSYHELTDIEYKQKGRFKKKGRPKKGEAANLMHWEIFFNFSNNLEKQEKEQKERQCYVLGTNQRSLMSKEIIETYKGMSSVELGFRFLKDPVFFASSLYLKKPSRLAALLMIMTLALLVYSIGQRRMRNYLKSKGKTLPNQIRKPIQTPTLRWLFYLLDDIYVLIFREGESTRIEIQGITPLKTEILQCFGETIGYFYGIK